MNDTSISAALADARSLDSRELDRACEQIAARLFDDGVEPAFDVTSADFGADPFLICADRYWRLRFLDQPTVETATACARWLLRWVGTEHRPEVFERWALGYAFITKDTVESRDELAEATERIVDEDEASGDVAWFATLYHAGKLRSNFWFDELYRFLESSLLAMAVGSHRSDPLFVALQAFAGLGSRIITEGHAVQLLDQAWRAPGRTRHVVDVCLNGLWVAAPFDAPGPLLRDRAVEAVAEFPDDHLFHFRLARGHRVCGDHEAAIDSIHTALRLLPAIGTRISHKLLQEQYMNEREAIQRERLHARTVAAQQRRWDQQERATVELRQTLQANTVRAVEVVAIFTAAIAFAVGSLQITLQGSLGLADRAWLVGLIGIGLVVFALLIVGCTWYITGSRRLGGRGHDSTSSDEL